MIRDHRYVNTVKYLGFVFCENKKDAEDMLRQLRTLYAKSNKVIRMFNHCTVVVKLLLIKSYCTSFYFGYLLVWSDYKSMTFSKLRVAFNNVYRRVLGLPKWSSAVNCMPLIILKILKHIGFQNCLNKCFLLPFTYEVGLVASLRLHDIYYNLCSCC